MSKGQKTAPRHSWLKPDIIVSLVLLVIVVVFAVWDGRHNNSASKSSSSSAAGWSEYKATKYGFKFSYPASWGTPAVSLTKGKTGSFYQVGFTGGVVQKTAKPSVLINMYSKDYVNTICSQTDCALQKSLDAQAVMDSLKNYLKLFIKHDDSSYATLNYSPSLHSSTLSDTQIVSVPKINVTAAAGLYAVTGAASCPIGKFAQATQQGCINNSDYNMLNKVMKSIQGV
jgi:hypothetical protein